jgi:hypothetical protein
MSLPPPRILNVFTPFSLQIGSNHHLHRRSQSIVWYAESRFRLALIEISKADSDRQVWMQMCLIEEIVGLMISRYLGPVLSNI